MRRLLPEPSDVVDLGEAYAVAREHRTHVRANFVSSADGAASLDGVSGGLSSPADKDVFRTLRGLADVVLVGAGTARREGYRPARVAPDVRSRRSAAGQAAVPPVAVVSGSLDLDLTSEFFTAAESRPLVVTHAAAAAERRTAVAEVADVVVAGAASVDVGRALDALAQRGLRHVLCEGGPTLLGAVAAAGRLDELCLSVSPLLAGPGAGRILEGVPLPAGVPLALRHVLEDGGMLFLRYSLAPSTSVRPSTPGSP